MLACYDQQDLDQCVFSPPPEMSAGVCCVSVSGSALKHIDKSKKQQHSIEITLCVVFFVHVNLKASNGV